MRTSPVVASPNTFLDISLRSNFSSPERISEVGVLGASNTLKIFFSRRSCKASCRLITSFPSELGSIGAVIGCMILLFHLLILSLPCLLYTSDAADDLLCVDLGGRRIIKKKKKK